MMILFYKWVCGCNNTWRGVLENKGAKDAWARWYLARKNSTWYIWGREHYREVLWALMCNIYFEAGQELLDHGAIIMWWYWDTGSHYSLWF